MELSVKLTIEMSDMEKQKEAIEIMNFSTFLLITYSLLKFFE
jgi:hypothetical protein